MSSAYPTSQRELKHCHLASLIFWPTQCVSHCSSENSTFGAREKDETSTAAYFLTIKALQRKKKRAQTLESYPHEYLAGNFFFFILLSTACLILIKPILHICLFVFH